MASQTLFLQFEMGADRFVLDCAQVLEVLPYLALKQIPQLPKGIAGIFDYRGDMSPVIDINEIILGIPAQERISTRIIMIRYHDTSGKPHPLGIIAEHASRTFRRNKDDFVASGVESRETPYLGPVATDANGLIQFVDAEKLLPPHIGDALFQNLAGAA